MKSVALLAGLVSLAATAAAASSGVQFEQASSSTSCQDDPTFQLSVSTDRDEHCTWIDIDANDTTFRRNEQCVSPKKQYIIDACPRACGVCCGDNPTFQFALHDIDKEEPIDNSEVSCAWLASSIPTQVEKDYYCIEKKIKYSCPSSCGICPTLSPTMSPTVYSSVAPSESPRVTMEVYYAAELYTSQILSDGNAVKDGMNTFFSMNRAVLASMDEEGIEDITFETFLVNGAIEDIDIQCGEIPEAYKDSICNTAFGTTSITYKQSTRRIRRRQLSENEVIQKVEQIVSDHVETATNSIAGLDGVSIKSMTGDMDSFAQATTTDDTEPENKKPSNGSAKVVVPILCTFLVVGLVAGAYFVHKRRQKAIVVELEESMETGDDNDHFIAPTKMDTSIIQTEQYPEEEPSFLDCVCGDQGNEEFEIKL